MSTALITGGTSGIGNAFARELGSQGYDLVLVARDTARLETVAEELRTSFGVLVDVITADLSVRDDLIRVAERLEDVDHPVDMLVNNAGFGLHSSLLDKDFSLQEKAMDVMCLAVLVLAGAAARSMIARGGHGNIINVSSTSGIITTGNYSAIKAWATTYTEGLAVELDDTDIKVTALLPGWVRTEFHARAGINASKLPDFVWLEADDLVKQCLEDNANGKVLSVPGRRWAAAYQLGRLLPRGLVRWGSGKLSDSRRT